MNNVISHPAFAREPIVNKRHRGPPACINLAIYRCKKMREQIAAIAADEIRKRRRLEELKAINNDHILKALELCGDIVELERELGLR